MNRPSVYVVEFKGSRKEYYRDPYLLPIGNGDFVIVQVERGEDIGRILLKLEPAKESTADIRPLPILRIANDDELARDAENRRRELDARSECIRMAAEHGLNMKVVDAEWQFDGNKMTFYFTAEKRVDFRRLVKDLAGVYKTRIELRQIGARDEARRVGGIGPCGFEQCCTMFLKEFEPITTQLARDQGLSLNPAKISGNCGRLLCCLRYESTYYKEAMRQFPDPGQSWQTADGAGTISDVNVLRDRMTVRLPDGRREHVTLDEIRQSKGKPESWFE
ncbi:MAG TPA: regulatory iron-sulfur-containing complex subunit RicT [candidate division Zixibacteria bacterium]